MSEQIQVCRCGAPFVMRSHHRTGRPNPITAYEVPNGNVVILPDGRYRIIGRDEHYEGPRYVSHFVDCPHAASFKQPRGSA